jgi:hypothetical protein
VQSSEAEIDTEKPVHPLSPLGMDGSGSRTLRSQGGRPSRLPSCQGERFSSCRSLSPMWTVRSPPTMPVSAPPPGVPTVTGEPGDADRSDDAIVVVRHERFLSPGGPCDARRRVRNRMGRRRTARRTSCGRDRRNPVSTCGLEATAGPSTTRELDNICAIIVIRLKRYFSYCCKPSAFAVKRAN